MFKIVFNYILIILLIRFSLDSLEYTGSEQLSTVMAEINLVFRKKWIQSITDVSLTKFRVHIISLS